jgi:RNA polymerase sigma-70 factor (ECF subfamily)
MWSTSASAASVQPEAPVDVGAIYDRHVDFVWRSLARFGVRESDLQDMLQEVFLVVHRRLGDRDPNASVTAWLFGICLRVAAAYRRRAHRRHEQLSEHMVETPAGDVDPERAAATQQEQALVAEILDEMDLEQRAVFVMFEVDELTCQQIATAIDCPLGTVYSRLRAARKSFELALRRRRAREVHAGGGGGGGR